MSTEERSIEERRRQALARETYRQVEVGRAKLHPRDAAHPEREKWLAKMRKGVRKRWGNMSAEECKKQIAKMQASRVNGAAHAAPHDATQQSPIPHAQSFRRNPLPHSHRGDAGVRPTPVSLDADPRLDQIPTQAPLPDHERGPHGVARVSVNRYCAQRADAPADGRTASPNRPSESWRKPTATIRSKSCAGTGAAIWLRAPGRFWRGIAVGRRVSFGASSSPRWGVRGVRRKSDDETRLDQTRPWRQGKTEI